VHVVADEHLKHDASHVIQIPLVSKYPGLHKVHSFSEFFD